MMSGAKNSHNFPFTATQFQELEHQALIYKYMVSNIPIPSDLLFTIKRSCYSLDPSKIFARHCHPPSHIGRSCFQMGIGRKVDPEPGRCRRTDGKKWRCSKEAFPDSKYCERHMHRGKNRSRKPVEFGTQTITTNSAAITKSSQQLHYNSTGYVDSAAASQLLCCSRSPGFGVSSQDSSNPLFLDSAASFSLSTADYRNGYGLKEEVDEHAFFSEPSGSMRSLSSSSMGDVWQFTPLTMNSSSNRREMSMSGLRNEYPYLQLRSFNEHDNAPKQQYQNNYDYISGNMRSEQREPQKTVHRFFDDLPPNNKNSWLDLDDKSQNSSSVSSTTRLSISIPSPSRDLLPHL